MPDLNELPDAAISSPCAWCGHNTVRRIKPVKKSRPVYCCTTCINRMQERPDVDPRTFKPLKNFVAKERTW